MTTETNDYKPTDETNLADYKPTEEEMHILFGDKRYWRSSYESFQTQSDTYKRTRISWLLFHRGDVEGAYRIIDGIESKMVRSSCRRALGRAILSRDTGIHFD